eukprot:TRINITY_DN65575_c0_g1_i2.p1 TRINITY_DN65575_c0_g1~~TRINITY_DN65575_c0_g1_i2.p1  ORF type:complete len:581 (-),score=95.90 TRINITY_DN65575_c0_g1_i2:201-1943(-)
MAPVPPPWNGVAGPASRDPASLSSNVAVAARDEQIFRRMLLKGYGTYVAAWRQLFDPHGWGYVDRHAFRAACRFLHLPRDLQVEVLMDTLAGAHAQTIMLEDLDVEAAQAIAGLADFLRINYGTAARAIESCAGLGHLRRKGAALNQHAFLRFCMEVGYDITDFRFLFECLDFRNSGYITADCMEFVTRWLLEPAAPPTLDEKLLEALERHADMEEIVQLVRQGADANLVPAEGDKTRFEGDFGSALIQACERGTVAHVKELLDLGADPCLLNMYGYSALHRASMRPGRRVDLTAVVQLLVMHKADINAMAPDLSTPLHLAASAGNHQVVATLSYLQADVHGLDSQGRSALFLAAWRDDLKCCASLMESSVDPCRVDRNGLSVLVWAKENAKEPLVELMQGYVRGNLPKIVPLSLDAAVAAAAEGAIEKERAAHFAHIRDSERVGETSFDEDAAERVRDLVITYLEVAGVSQSSLSPVLEGWRKTRARAARAAAAVRTGHGDASGLSLADAHPAEFWQQAVDVDLHLWPVPPAEHHHRGGAILSHRKAEANYTIRKAATSQAEWRPILRGRGKHTAIFSA